MRISIPTLPTPSLSSPAPPNPLAHLDLARATAHVAAFLDAGKERTLMITGAGVSVDSGIRAYRGDDGHYTTNPNYRPIFYGELVEPGPKGRSFRQRYWSRSYLGYPPVRDAQPNPTHMYVAALQRLGIAPNLITQNVDRLHHKAWRGPGPSSAAASGSKSGTAPATGADASADEHILELHGTLAFVHCTSPHRHTRPRDEYQDALSAANPQWEEFVRMAKRGEAVRTNPDGDVDLRGVSYESFVVPPCAQCEALRKGGAGGSGSEAEAESIVKPNVVFFGETISDEVRDRSMRMIADASRVLVLGSSLATFSAFRLIRQAVEAAKPVLMVSLGPSRADALPGVEKIEMKAGPVLRGVLEKRIGHRHDQLADEVRAMMRRGVVKEADRVEGPRAEG